jgi:hypothetical protein
MIKIILAITSIFMSVSVFVYSQDIPVIKNDCPGYEYRDEPTDKNACLGNIFSQNDPVCCFLKVSSNTTTRKACVKIPFIGFKDDSLAVYKDRYNGTTIDFVCEQNSNVKPSIDGDFYPSNNGPKKTPLVPGIINTCSDLGPYQPDTSRNCTSFTNQTMNCCYINLTNFGGSMCLQSPKNADLQAFKDSSRVLYGEINIICSAQHYFITFLSLISLLILI